MSEHRTWDENRSPQWKYLFQKEAMNRRKTRKDLEREYKEKREQENEEYGKTIKFGKSSPIPNRNRIRKKSVQKSGSNTRKVSKEQLREKLEAANKQNDAKIKKLFNNIK